MITHDRDEVQLRGQVADRPLAARRLFHGAGKVGEHGDELGARREHEHGNEAEHDRHRRPHHQTDRRPLFNAEPTLQRPHGLVQHDAEEPGNQDQDHHVGRDVDDRDQRADQSDRGHDGPPRYVVPGAAGSTRDRGFILCRGFVSDRSLKGRRTRHARRELQHGVLRVGAIQDRCECAHDTGAAVVPDAQRHSPVRIELGPILASGARIGRPETIAHLRLPTRRSNHLAAHRHAPRRNRTTSGTLRRNPRLHLHRCPRRRRTHRQPTHRRLPRCLNVEPRARGRDDGRV